MKTIEPICTVFFPAQWNWVQMQSTDMLFYALAVDVKVRWNYAARQAYVMDYWRDGI